MASKGTKVLILLQEETIRCLPPADDGFFPDHGNRWTFENSTPSAREEVLEDESITFAAWLRAV